MRSIIIEMHSYLISIQNRLRVLLKRCSLPIKAFVFSCAVLFSSCSKEFLTKIPEDQLSDAIFWKTENDATIALTGLYSGWENYTTLGWMDMISDIAYSKFPTPFQVMGNGQMNASAPGKQLFNFTQIRKYNNFLEKVDQIEMDAAKKEIYKAETRFLRAYDYWWKAELYNDVPLVTNTIPSSEEAKINRNPKSEVIDFVLSELNAIIPILPVKTMVQSGGHATKGAALALKARCELFEGKYAEAMESAKMIMDMGIYELYPSYSGLFQIDNENVNNESIMEIVYVENTYSNELWLDILGGNEGAYAVINPTDKLVNLYEMANGKTIDDPTSGYDPNKPFKNRDPRLDMTVLYPGHWFNGRYYDPFALGSPDYWQEAVGFRSAYGFMKWAKAVPSAALDNCGMNFMVFRLAEMQLIYAEAAIESNQITNEMYDAIDAVRVRSGMPVVDRVEYSTQAKLRDLVRRERSVELALEGVRYLDIKRWDIGAQTLSGPLNGSKQGTVDAGTGEFTITGDNILLENRIFHPERNYLLPIPQSEMDANPNIVQNPGY
ncbi:MAG: RagB/SusD family nutrient uptake outer membrane protein [Flavitalea sp.]